MTTTDRRPTVTPQPIRRSPHGLVLRLACCSLLAAMAPWSPPPAVGIGSRTSIASTTLIATDGTGTGQGTPGASPVIEVDPESLASSLHPGETETQALTISNLGDAALDWTILLDGGKRGVNRPLGPVPAAVDATGRGRLLSEGVLLVANRGIDHIVALDPESGDVLDPNFISIENITQGNKPHVLLHPDGERVLVSAQTQDVVHAYDVDGAYLGVFAPSGGADTTILDNVRGMAIHPATGNLLVTSDAGGNSDSVVEFDSEGNFLGRFIDSGAGGISSPWYLHFRSADALLSDGIGDDIYRFAPDGTFLHIWNEDPIAFPQQVVETAGGNVLVAAFSAPSGVWELDPDGTVIDIYDPVTALAGVFELANGTILVTNSGGIHQINRDNELIETKITGNSSMIGFAQTIDCTLPGWVSPVPASGSVPGGMDQVVDVTFDATGLEPGDFAANLCISSNDPVNPLIVVPLTLSVIDPAGEPELTFDPPSLDFGDVEVGSTSSPQTATLQNTGDGDATGLAFNGLPAGGFAADTVSCGSLLPAGASCEVSVTFTPMELGTATAALEATADQDSAATLDLSGSGVAAAPQDHETLLVSRADGTDGPKGDGFSGAPWVSADGRFVAFESSSTNLHPDDTDTTQDVFVRDLVTQETTLVSRAGGADGVKGNGASVSPSISADGRFVAFETVATNLHPDDTDFIRDLYVRDLQTHELILVSRAGGADGEKGNGSSTLPSLSADGRFVAFQSVATNLHPDDVDDALDVLVRDLQTDETLLVSRAGGVDGAKGDGPSLDATISAEGRFVAFHSAAANLHADDPDGTRDVFVRDLEIHETILASRADGSDGPSGDEPSTNPWISADGRFVGFESAATNLHPDDPDDGLDVFVRDLQADETILASRAGGVDGVKGSATSVNAAISADGRFVAFESAASNLHPDDPDGVRDVFVRDLHTHETHLASRASGDDGEKGNANSTQPSTSADGRFVAFQSQANTLHPDDPDFFLDVYLRDVLGPFLVTPARLDFGAELIGGTAGPLSVTLSNDGGEDVEVDAVSSPQAPFAAAGGTCDTPPFIVPAGGSCTLGYVFGPTARGTAETTVTIASDAADGPHEITLIGSGISSLAIAPDPLDLGEVHSGETGEPQAVTLINVSDADVAVSEVTDPGAPFVPAGGSCGTPPFTLGPQATCTLAYAFAPTAEGPASATVTVTSDAPSSPDAFALQGIGLPARPIFVLDPESFDVTLEAGQATTESLLIGNPGGAPLTWTIDTAEPPSAGSRSPDLGPMRALPLGAETRNASDIASALGATIPGLRPTQPVGGVVDCDAEPGIVIHDDGTVESGYSGNPIAGITEVRFADEFTPSAYPATFSAVCLAFVTLDEGPSTLDLDIVVFDDDGPGGSPGTELGSLHTTVTDIPVFPNATPAWASFDISSLGVTVIEGSVFIGVRYAPPSPVNVFLAADESPENPVGFAGGYWWNSNSGTWQPIQEGGEAFEEYRSMFVRAVEEVSDCADPGVIPWLSVTPAAGETPGGGGSDVTLTVDTAGLPPGIHEALLCVLSNDPARPLAEVPIRLTVTAVPAPALAFEPSSLAFGDVEVDTTSPPRTTMLTNSGDVDATGVTFAPLADGFAADTGDCGPVLAVGASCTVSVTFSPTEPGEVGAALEVDSIEGATATAGLIGNGVGGGGFTPIALEVDPAGLTPEANGVFEPGEAVEVAPTWRNDGELAASLGGTASNFTGPAGAAYSIDLEAADYGLIELGDTASCLDTEVCYRLGLDDPVTRPAAHWDATFDETLDDTDGTTRTWTLHIGESFADVPTANPFYPAIETLLHSGITGGCTAGAEAAGLRPGRGPDLTAGTDGRHGGRPLQGGAAYCPGGANSRAQMPVFVLRALEGAGYTPPACVEGKERFNDVPFDSTFCRWIQDLANRGIVSGCGDGDYCPGNPVTRAQMSIFLLKTLLGADYTPPECSNQFTDVPCPSLFADWIEDLAARGITSGCTATEYCPGDAVTRAQMAVFISRAFGFTLYGP